MADATTALLTTNDGRPLKAALATAQARAKRRAFLLVLPLLIFVLLSFLVPIAYMLKRSVEHDGFSASAPSLSAWFAANPDVHTTDIPEEAYAALVKDLALMQTDRADGLTAQVLRPLEVDARTHREIRAAKAAGTKVDFFTMVRGEDK